VTQRYLKKGVLDEKEYEKHMKGLPDLADQAVPIEADLDAPGADLDDEDEEDEADGGGGQPKEA
jgi:hypothetical protein